MARTSARRGRTGPKSSPSHPDRPRMSWAPKPMATANSHRRVPPSVSNDGERAMTRTPFRRLLAVAAILLAAPAALTAAETKAAVDKPNIIFILADDLGLDGVGCYGSDTYKSQTPNLDTLAKTGVRLEACYAAPLCGPSRCLFLTGRYAFRTGGLTNQSWQQGGPGAKAKDEYPIARLLKENGYSTCQTGKWRQVGQTPKAWGFDEYCTDNTASGWYWKKSYI